MNRLTVREMASIGFPVGFEGGWMMMLQAYFDDSGTHGSASPVVVIGGLIAAEPQWHAFDKAWSAALEKPLPGKPPIKKWSTADCWARSGEFAGYSIKDKDDAFDRFRGIVAASGAVSVSMAVDNFAWNELVSGDLRAAHTPESICLTGCVEKACKYASGHPVGDKIAIYYDIGRKSAATLRIGALFEERASYNPRVVSFAFMRICDSTPLQGADMCATQSYWYAQECIKHGEKAEKRPHFSAWCDQIDGAGFLADRASIIQELARRNASGSVKTI